ncbi:TatD family nuclease-associated radical SAM protein [Shewanella zhangzhouensis]|uniref:TatD family nuclease-associated radical SAM protein n=1 Tax=Shewanella zhangzhouensis TaxID=2864213 RepID=UPI001C65A4DF|nr:TatD family nuclease-associated radical SAM protein [Shewanella zhangzhouensis]QYK04394.1 TatD family nuclease-associated radical SAM protein [Shewanella zhangzhouensis]
MNSMDATAANHTSPSATLVYDIRRSRYLNITGRCTLRCGFCPKQQGSRQIHQYQLALDKQPGVDDLLPLLGDVGSFDEYVFCGYGEPTLNLPTLLGVARAIKARGGRVRVNTDGLGNLFHRRNILPELADCVDALSVSLNAQDELTYLEHCQPKLKGSWQAVNDFIRMAPAYIKRVEVSAIDGLPGVNIPACRALVEAAGCIFKRRKLDIMG